jgi:sensor histidine kinase regulating citrate/malate metabolism
VGAGGVAQMVAYLSRKPTAVSSNPSTVSTQKQTNKQQQKTKAMFILIAVSGCIRRYLYPTSAWFSGKIFKEKFPRKIMSLF